jgi:hypothetical protein
MTLRRLLEFIDKDASGIGAWPVMFASLRLSAAGVWEDSSECEPITSVRVCDDEVLLIRDIAQSPLSVEQLRADLTQLVADHGDYTVDTCEPPIEMEEYGSVHIDLPINGVVADNARQRFLIVLASS